LLPNLLSSHGNDLNVSSRWNLLYFQFVLPQPNALVDSNQLINLGIALKEGLSKEHLAPDAANAPDVHFAVIGLVIEDYFWGAVELCYHVVGQMSTRAIKRPPKAEIDHFHCFSALSLQKNVSS
jgi:hypothetical protein